MERPIDASLHRSAKSRRLPARFRDDLPAPAAPVQLTQKHITEHQQHLNVDGISKQQPPPEPKLQRDDGNEDCSPAPTITNKNSFGVFRKYFMLSSHNPRDPDAFADVPVSGITPPAQTTIGSGLAAAAPTGSQNDSPTSSENPSEGLLLAWMTLGAGATPTGMNELVRNVILHPEFNPEELKGFDAVTALRRFDREHHTEPEKLDHEHCPEPEKFLKTGDGWREGSVKIRVPCTRVKQCEEEAPEFVVDGILYRDVAEVIKTELEDPEKFESIHTVPYEEWWYPGPGKDPVRIYSEIYNSNAMLEADRGMRDHLQAVHDLADGLETFIISALLYSDSTHLASFGHASLWPVYLFLGNISKYTRLKPTTLSAHHIAYIPTVSHNFPCSILQSDRSQQLPDSIKEFYREHYQTDPTAEMLTHLGRELTHAVLRLILGGSFANAHKKCQHVKCGDDVWRRWLLRLLLHSADYKEKCVSWSCSRTVTEQSLRALLAAIRSMGMHLCPRCLITKSQVPDIGTDLDQNRRRKLRDYKDGKARVEMARKIIFDNGMSVGGDLEILKDGSWVPTRVGFFRVTFNNGSRVSECLLDRTGRQPSRVNAC